MRRAIQLLGVAAGSIALVASGWLAKPDQPAHPQPGAQNESIHTLLRHPVDFAKNRLTGGIGVMLGVDSPTGLPMVQALGAGSPAERAGLKAGDVITKIDGVDTTRVPMAQIADSIRGIAAINVTLSILRKGRAQPFDCAIRRRSWNSLSGLMYQVPPSSQMFTIIPGSSGGMRVWTLAPPSQPQLAMGSPSWPGWSNLNLRPLRPPNATAAAPRP